MKNNIFSITLIIISVIVIGSIAYEINNKTYENNINNKINTNVKSGQVWVYETENPFEEDHYWYVIEIKEGYVKFCKIRYDEENKHWEIPIKNIFTSDKISIFTSVYKKIEQQEHRQQELKQT